MAALPAVTINAIMRVATPVIADIYKASKGGVRKAYSRWQESTFPRRLARKIGGLALVKTLWKPDDDVSLLKFYHPPKIRSLDQRREKPVSSMTDIGSENIVIEGIVGQGKSIFLRWLAIEQAKNESNGRLPVFIELRTLHKGYLLRDAIYKVLESYEISIDDEAFEHLASSGKMILLLDAFDELDESLIRETLNQISFFSRKYDEMQIVITSRPGNEIQKVPGFKVTRIMSLKPDEYSKFLSKMGLSAVKNAAIVEAIKGNKGGLSNLITTPLMLTLVAIVYESEKEIPPTLPEFFERLFHIVLTKHDRLKDGFSRKRSSGLSDRKLQELFEAFCFMTIQCGYGRSLTGEQFSKVFKQAVDYSEDCRCDQEKFQSDIVKGACLMLEEGVDTVTFLHKSLMEYYAAAFIRHSTDEVAEMFYKAAGENQRAWREVVRFLSSIDSYRYSKEFALPQIEILKAKHIKPFADKNDKNILRMPWFCNYEESYASYIKDGADGREFHLALFGYSVGDGHMFEEALSDIMLHALFRSLPATAKREKVESILGVKLDLLSDATEVQVRNHRVIEYVGPDVFWNALSRYEGWLSQQEAMANTIIAKNDKRKNIFLPRKR